MVPAPRYRSLIFSLKTSVLDNNNQHWLKPSDLLAFDSIQIIWTMYTYNLILLFILQIKNKH